MSEQLFELVKKVPCSAFVFRAMVEIVKLKEIPNTSRILSFECGLSMDGMGNLHSVERISIGDIKIGKVVLVWMNNEMSIYSSVRYVSSEHLELMDDRIVVHNDDVRIEVKL